MPSDRPRRYGAIEQTVSETDVEFACESIRHLGYAVVDGGYELRWLQTLSDAFERARQRYFSENGGADALKLCRFQVVKLNKNNGGGSVGADDKVFAGEDGFFGSVFRGRKHDRFACPCPLRPVGEVITH